MKKSLLLLALAIGGVASAQEFKQAAGSHTLELGFAPLGGSPISISGLQYRMFKTETMAYRLGIFVGFASESKVDSQAVAAVGTNASRNELRTKTSNFEINLTPGFEKHMAGTDRLSPYWGGVLDIGYKMNKKVQDYEAAATSTDASKVETMTTKNKDGFVRIGAGLVFGTDYYFAKKFYIGAECGFGLSFKKMSNIKSENSVAPVAPAVAPADQVQGSTFNLAPTVNGKLRLGWNF